MLNGDISDMQRAMAATLDPVRAQLVLVEEAISERELELKELREIRAQAKKLLGVIEPPEPKPVRRGGGSGTRQISDAQVEKVYQRIVNSDYASDSFCAKDIEGVVGIHQTTIHKALKALHDQGRLRLDHLGGPRHTTRYFAVVGNDG